uniref:Uncharacterized protein n=1 Tax=Arundo donax TaxID=35708 RepID=A0A0A9HLI5_ARUDO
MKQKATTCTLKVSLVLPFLFSRSTLVNSKPLTNSLISNTRSFLNALKNKTTARQSLNTILT